MNAKVQIYFVIFLHLYQLSFFKLFRLLLHELSCRFVKLD